MAPSIWSLALAFALVAPHNGATTAASPVEFTGQQKVIGDASLDNAGAQHQLQHAGQRRLNGKFLHITDLHPDEFYEAHSSTSSGVACHRGKGSAGFYGAETSDCDSPFSLLNATLAWIADNVVDEIDFVVWTGDTARHDSDEKVPRTREQVLGTNRRIADQFYETFTKGKHNRRGVPVVPNLGNNDILPHNILVPGPTKWLQYYTDVWRHFIPEEQRHSFEFGGWFDVEVIPNKLSVFSLNTLYLFDRNAAVDGCNEPSEPGYKQMEWLRIQLQLIRERGMKAILIGHVPPARTDSKQNWDETCWQKYNLWMRQYRDVVVASLYGHMNIDHFIAHDTADIQFTTRETMEDDFAVESAADYLQELRHNWSKIPKFDVKALDDGTDDDYFDEDDSVDAEGKKKKKKHKGKKKKKIGKYAERYHVSLISPSIVPNYFPTIRVFEYNISGLETNAIWGDTQGSKGSQESQIVLEPWTEDLRKRQAEAAAKGKGKKGKKPKDPQFVVPDPPSKSSPPGPAYSPQPLTLLGYTQYYANLTYLNNDMTGENDASSERWRDGIHKDKEPKTKKPHPRPFAFEIEYSTFTDKIFRLKDLTVRSYVKLAYRIGQQGVKGNSMVDDVGTGDEGDGVDSLDPDDFEDDDEVDDEDDVDVQGKKKGRKNNKVWLHFLDHAFVGTVPKKQLKKM